MSTYEIASSIVPSQQLLKQFINEVLALYGAILNLKSGWAGPPWECYLFAAAE